jgi:hypothetical protein
MRARFDSDAAYITHPRSGAIYYAPLDELVDVPVRVRHVDTPRRDRQPRASFRWANFSSHHRNGRR